MLEQQKPILVELLNPPFEDPWRTHGDYIEDQRRQQWQFRLTVAALIVTSSLQCLQLLQHMRQFKRYRKHNHLLAPNDPAGLREKPRRPLISTLGTTILRRSI